MLQERKKELKKEKEDTRTQDEKIADAAKEDDAPALRKLFVAGIALGSLIALTLPQQTDVRRRLTPDPQLNGCFEGAGWNSATRVDRLAALQEVNPDIPASTPSRVNKAIWLAFSRLSTT